MTREEAIADIRDNIKPVVGGKSLDMALKALEQEPVLDKIRTEIEQIMAESGKAIRPFDGMKVVTYTKGFQDGIGSAIDVIDKYKAEGSEE